MKKLIVTLIILIVLILSGCNQDNNPEEVSDDPIKSENLVQNDNKNSPKEEFNLKDICISLANSFDEQLISLGLQNFSCQLDNFLCSCKPLNVDNFEVITNFETGSTILYINKTESVLLVGPESNFKWMYYERDGAELCFEVEEYMSPFSRTNGDAVIVNQGSIKYGYEENNTLRFRVSGLTPDTIEYCISSKGLKLRGYSDILVEIYVPIDAQWDLSLEGSHPISNIKDQTEAKKVLKFIEYIPPIDDFGFVDMKYVDSSWCFLETNQHEYKDIKPICEKRVNKLKK